MNKIIKYLENLVNNLRETILNKLMALAIIIIGILVTNVRDDGTFLVLALLFCIPLFFAKESYIQKD